MLEDYKFYIQSSLLKISHFQKLAYSVRTMFAIVEKMISLASFDIRLAHARISVVFSYLIFSNFKFCLRKFKGLITLKKIQGFLKISHHFRMRNLYFSINPTKINCCLFYKNLFSILNFTASGRFRTAATSEMELFCDSS